MSYSLPNTSNDRILKFLACDFVELYAAHIGAYIPTDWAPTERKKIERKREGTKEKKEKKTQNPTQHIGTFTTYLVRIKNIVTKIKTILK